MYETFGRRAVAGLFRIGRGLLFAHRTGGRQQGSREENATSASLRIARQGSNWYQKMSKKRSRRLECSPNVWQRHSLRGIRGGRKNRKNFATLLSYLAGRTRHPLREWLASLRCGGSSGTAAAAPERLRGAQSDKELQNGTKSSLKTS